MKEKIRTILFIGILFGLSIVNILKPMKYFSNKENRYLQTLPKFEFEGLVKGKFGQEFESYTTDQFIGRDFWIAGKTLSDLALGKRDNTRVYFAKDSYLIDRDEPIDEEQFLKNMDNINSFIKDTSNIGNINILLIPSKSEALRDKLPKYAPTIDEKYLVERIKSSLNPNPNLKVLDLIDSLTSKSNEDIYYRTDHHWTSKGAFYGYSYFLNTIGEESLKEEDFVISKVSDEFLGTSYRKANLYFGRPDSIYNYSPKEDIGYEVLINDKSKIEDIYDESYLSKTDKYSYFFGGDKALIEINTSIKNGKNIIIFKDSFANSFIPFLMNHYENILVVDTRYYNRSIKELLEEKSIGEILLLYNVQNLAREKSFNRFGK